MKFKDCGHKIRHPSLTDAQEHADSIMGRLALASAPIVPYFCDKHDSYHVGHNRKLPMDVAQTVTAAAWTRAALAKEITELGRECDLLDLLAKINHRDDS